MMLRVASVARPHVIRGLARLTLIVLGAAAVLLPNQSQANDFCPDIYRGGVFRLNFNPTFTNIDKYNFFGNQYDGLLVSSFFNSIKNASGTSTVGFFQRALVARITGIGYRTPAWFNASRDTEILTDLDLPPIVEPLDQANMLPTNSGPGQQVWPNETRRVPDGVLPFEAIVSPQGFHPTPEPGRLTLINLDDYPNRQEYIIDQSLQEPVGPCRFEDAGDFNPLVRPYFYHKVKWVDMDGDGLKDAVTVRAGFKVSGAFCIPPPGQVV